MIDAGLVIASPWIEKIVAGEKIWEIRSKPNGRTGRIALARKGGSLMATCTIGASVPLSNEDFAKYFAKHRVPPEALTEFYGDANVYAWPLSDVRRLEPPIRYKHPGGGSWVRLSPANVSEFDRLQHP
jgi:hypothetical protein